DGNQGYFTVDNPYWQGATGYLGGKNIDLGNITISDVSTTDNLNFASIQLISLDSLPIPQSKKMILLTSARLENQGLKWNDTKTALVSVGGTRALCEPVEAIVTFKSSSADSLSVYMLNPTGNRTDSLLVSQAGESAKFSLNKNTLWYEISNHLKKPVTSGKKSGINKNMMNIYPNPGKEYSVVEFSFPVNDQADFILYNAFGQMIMNEPVLLASNQLQQKQIDVSYLSDGIYFYGFQFKNGKRVIDKLVISK
ncbi:MAG TPA: T9SS type A sorting domain-containing protein, partial [Draconibacterium sp.]|nr:T9SS type A sorting domain-containing protein [Draconibacterium sp.]